MTHDSSKDSLVAVRLDIEVTWKEHLKVTIYG